MNRLGKKLAASVLALTLVVAMSTSCFAATWGSYFGAPAWYEAAEGQLASESAKGWTANLTTLGWGGIWGAQIFQNTTQGYGKVDIKKGQTYTLSFSMKSTNCDKWVYVKISTGENLAFNDWLQLKKGTTYNYKKTFTAKSAANSIYFGLGGDAGDRAGVSTDEDAEIRYAALKGGAATLVQAAEDATAATQISMSNFSLSGKLVAVSNKKTNIKNLNAFLKNTGKITAKQSGYKCTIKRSGSAVVLQAKKGKKNVVNIKVKTSNYKKVFKKINKKGANALNKVLKAKTGLTLKNIGR